MANKYDDKGNEKKPKLKGYVSAVPSDKYKIKEQFKGEVMDIPIKFPKDLGVEHPFNFEDIENTCNKIGIVSGGVNKITDFIVGDFSIRTNDEKIKKVLDDFTKQTNFATNLTEWVKEGVGKGNGFMENDLVKQKVKVHNANNMYVRRTKKGVVKEYTQWIHDLKRYTRGDNKLITFKPNQIAHLKINKIAGKAYGMGIVYPNERIIENIVLNEESLHKLIDRKAGAPIHAKVGQPGENVNPTDVDDFKDKLTFLTNSTEWVTDANVDMKVIEFGEIGKNITDTLNHDMEILAFGMEIPIVLWGAGNIPEGLAKVQLEVMQRKIRAIQSEIEHIIEEQIFRPLLESKGLKGDVEFVWNLPGEEEKNKRIEKLTTLIENFNVSEPLRRMCELEVARLLDLEDAPKFLTKPEKETEEEKNPKPTPAPVPPGQPKPPKEIGVMTVKEFLNIMGVSINKYSDCLVHILRRLRVEKFESLNLKEDDVKKLRSIFKEGFRRNQTINQIEKDINDSIKLKKEKVKIIIKAEIARLANLGLTDIVNHKEKEDANIK